MSDFQLEIGDSISGLLTDGVEGTPWVGATIKMDRRRGLVVEVPYLQGADDGQFDHVRHWFESRKAPTNMELLTPEGAIGLFGWVIVRHLALGRLRLVSSGHQSQYLNHVMGLLKTLLL